VPPPRKVRNNDESVMQRQLIRWWRSYCPSFGVPEFLLMSIPNGFNGDARRGSVMKAEGLRRGAPDLFLSVPQKDRNQGRSDNECYADWLSDLHGLFLELKTPTGRLSPEQEVFHQRLTEQGYKVVVVRSLEEGIREITDYLS
jgi:hypothetical protein